MKLKMTLLAGLVVSQFAVAEENFRQHDAHVHGHVEFNIAQDGQDLFGGDYGSWRGCSRLRACPEN